MNYADYYDCDICNGNQVGMSLFVAGCPFRCQGCFNSDIWDYDSGKEWTIDVEEKFLKLVGRDYIKRVSFLGGSPLCDKNVTDILCLIKKIRLMHPDKKIWVYTGYSWESIIKPDNVVKDIYQQARKEAMNYIDVLVDGPFDLESKDLTIAFRGSSNQRIIDVAKSLEKNEVILWNSEI